MCFGCDKSEACQEKGQVLVFKGKSDAARLTAPLATTPQVEGTSHHARARVGAKQITLSHSTAAGHQRWSVQMATRRNACKSKHEVLPRVLLVQFAAVQGRYLPDRRHGAGKLDPDPNSNGTRHDELPVVFSLASAPLSILAPNRSPCR